MIIRLRTHNELYRLVTELSEKIKIKKTAPVAKPKAKEKEDDDGGADDHDDDDDDDGIDEDDEPAEFAKHFPQFILVLRDFFLNILVDGKTVIVRNLIMF